MSEEKESTSKPPLESQAESGGESQTQGPEPAPEAAVPPPPGATGPEATPVPPPPKASPASEPEPAPADQAPVPPPETPEPVEPQALEADSPGLTPPPVTKAVAPEAPAEKKPDRTGNRKYFPESSKKQSRSVIYIWLGLLVASVGFLIWLLISIMGQVMSGVSPSIQKITQIFGGKSRPAVTRPTGRPTPPKPPKPISRPVVAPPIAAKPGSSQLVKEVASLANQLRKSPGNAAKKTAFSKACLRLLDEAQKLYKAGKAAKAKALLTHFDDLVGAKSASLGVAGRFAYKNGRFKVIKGKAGRVVAVWGTLVHRGSGNLDQVIVRAMLTDRAGNPVAVSYARAGHRISPDQFSGMKEGPAYASVLAPVKLSLKPGGDTPYMAVFVNPSLRAARWRVKVFLASPPK